MCDCTSINPAGVFFSQTAQNKYETSLCSASTSTLLAFAAEQCAADRHLHAASADPLHATAATDSWDRQTERQTDGQRTVT